jgi:hypothetical protein
MEFDAVVDRIVSQVDSIQPWLAAHSVYVIGQPRWQAPLVRPLVGVDELPDEPTVLELHRANGRGVMRLLFDPDRVTVSGCSGDNPRVNDARGAFRRSLLEASGSSAGRSEGAVMRESMGTDDSVDSGTNESLPVDIKNVTIKMPRAMTSHDSCTHEKTKDGRAACRRARKGGMRGDRAS